MRTADTDKGARRPAARGALAPLAALVLVLGLAACSGARVGTGNLAAPATSAPAIGNPVVGDRLIPGLVRRVEPSVVTIQQDQGEGSGIVWSADGVIVTNNHVVEGSRTVEVVFADGKRADGSVVATSPEDDLAVVRADRKDLPPATFAGREATVGELAVAIGNPLGFENSVTAGIVSGLHRSIPGSAQTGDTALVDLLQTDAPISPGNSGGALIGADGQVIGVNVAYIPPSAGSVSLGFAIPSQRARYVVEQLLEKGTVAHAWLGVTYRELTPDIAQEFGIGAKAGIIVTAVDPGGPAARAGIGQGDVIVGAEGRQLEAPEELLGALRARKPGDQLRLSVLRDGTTSDVTVTLGQQPTSGG